MFLIREIGIAALKSGIKQNVQYTICLCSQASVANAGKVRALFLSLI